MRWIVAVLMFGMLPVLAHGSQQGTPQTTNIAESDSLWGGNGIESLPTCDSAPLCMAALTQSNRGDEYYYGVIQNNSDQWLGVQRVAATLIDDAGEAAATGDSVSINPSVISPRGHALVMITVTGEYISDFTYEASFTSEPSTGGPDGFGVPIRVDQASVRGTGVLGEVTNSSTYDFGVVYTNGVCLGEDGEIDYWFQGEAVLQPFPIGATARFSAELHGTTDCSRFVVAAWGNPYA